MRVETPQILWHAEENKGINAALMSVTLLKSGIVDNNVGQYGNVLVTAGNSREIHLWRISSSQESSNASASSAPADSSHSVFHKSNNSNKRSPLHRVEFMCSLSRHDGPVNTVAFSPDGLHLATGGETGSIIVWSVPTSKRGNGNGQHYWSTVQREQDLVVRVVSRSGEGICDLSWSADSKRFLAGTIDHAVFVCEDASTGPVQETQWTVVYRNSMDHTHFVQGVTYDPLGVYLASMSSDRSVRVYPRKTPAKSKKKVLRPNNGSATTASSSPTSSTAIDSIPPLEHQQAVACLLTDTKLEIGKSKLVKYRRTVLDETGTESKQNLFADEYTLESFVRRLSWTTDGAFLVTPAAVWHEDPTDGQSTPSYATLLFARHRFDEPYRVLHGLEKPSIAVRPNPVLFSLPSIANDESKENRSIKQALHLRAPGGLPYRSVFAVLTWDSVLIYDTYHLHPLSIVRGIHYAHLVDACWSADGHTLVVCSTDGYVSFISFSQGELGAVYEERVCPVPKRTTTQSSSTTSTQQSLTMNVSLPSRTLPQAPLLSKPLPPCDPGPAIVEAPPSKRAKTRITPTLVSHSDPQAMPSTSISSSKRSAADETDTVGEAVDKLSLTANRDEPQKKKKKRAQLILV